MQSADSDSEADVLCKRRARYAYSILAKLSFSFDLRQVRIVATKMDSDTFFQIFFGIIATVIGVAALWVTIKYRDGKSIAQPLLMPTAHACW